MLLRAEPGRELWPWGRSGPVGGGSSGGQGLSWAAPRAWLPGPERGAEGFLLPCPLLNSHLRLPHSSPRPAHCVQLELPLKRKTRSSLVAQPAVVQVRSLAQELPRAMGTAKKKDEIQDSCPQGAPGSEALVVRSVPSLPGAPGGRLRLGLGDSVDGCRPRNSAFGCWGQGPLGPGL